MQPSPELIERFCRDLDPLVSPDARLGLAVSGGPDSLALLLLAAAARPSQFEVAAVDHGLRAESRSEAEAVGEICNRLGVPFALLTVNWKRKPQSALQERARIARYRLLAAWAKQRDLEVVATAHHLDDQVETFLMRLQRGVGVKGLAAMRRLAPMPGSDLPLVRPLLGWQRSELAAVCSAAGLSPVQDPSNADAQFERVRVRHALAAIPELDVKAVGQSLSYLRQADAALHWAAAQEWDRAVTAADREIVYRPDGAPQEIRRRIVSRAIARLATEGRGMELRGREVDGLLAALRGGRTVTLRGVLCRGGEEWRFIPAPNRTRPAGRLR